MTLSSHIEILSKGVLFWNNWRENNPNINPDLKKGNFRGENFSGANFKNADCAFADLSSSTLMDTDFTGANLNMADLKLSNMKNSILEGAKLWECNLYKSNLENENLTLAVLNESTLAKSNLKNALLRGAVLRGCNLKEANLINAVLDKTDFRNSIRSKTIISNRKDLLDSIVDSTAGFEFVSDNLKKERDERNKRAHNAFGKQEKGSIKFYLPNSYGPAQVGRILFLFSFLYEGIRLAFTAPFNSMEDLLSKAMRPELYGAYEDNDSLQLHSLTKGSIIGELVGNKGVTGFIRELKSLQEDDILKKIEVWDKSARLIEDRKKSTLESLNNQKDSTFKELDSWSRYYAMDYLPSELKKEIEDRIISIKGKIDNLDQRIMAATKIYDQAINDLFLNFSTLGGFAEVDGYPLFPQLEGGSKCIE